MSNLYAQLKEILGDAPVQVATVLSSASGSSIVQLPGGAQLTVRGTATVNSAVYIKGDVIESSAPALPLFNVDV